MKYKIDLKEKKEQTLIEKIIYFALHYLRYIIVLTQLVVILVFFYRFKVDQTIIDTKEAVDQKKEIIQVAYPLIEKAEAIDKKTKEIKDILSSQREMNIMFQYIFSVFPESLILNEVGYEKQEIELKGIAIDPKQLQNFYNILKKDNKFGKVNLTNIEKEDEGFTFLLKLENFNAEN